MKIAYLGYDVLYPCLTALEKAGCTIGEIFTCETDGVFEFNSKVCAFAKEHGIPCRSKKITLEDIHRLRDEGYEAIFCAGYFFKVPIDHSLPIINVHPAMLPIGRGAWPMPVAILRGLPTLGVTLHKMEKEFDAGDILIQKAFPIGERDNLETVTEKICSLAQELIAKLIADFDRYWLNATPQGDSEYWDFHQKSDYTITENTTPKEADAILRAFYGFDCYLKKDDDTEICVIKGEFLPQEHSMAFATEFIAQDNRKGYAVSGGIILS